MNRFTEVLITIVALALLGTVVVPVYKSIMADGRVEYCYTEMMAPDGMAPQYRLMAFRNWREDRRIGIYPTLEEARKAADVYGCKMGVR